MKKSYSFATKKILQIIYQDYKIRTILQVIHRMIKIAKLKKFNFRHDKKLNKKTVKIYV